MFSINRGLDRKMGAKDLERKLKKKKIKDGESQTMNSNSVQNGKLLLAEAQYFSL